MASTPGSRPLSWVAIANPDAGRAGEVARALQLLRRSGWAGEVFLAPQPGDAAHLASAAHAADGLLVLGGDGTLAQVINAMDRPRQVLAVVPCGHGNCLARDLGLAQVPNAIQAVHAGQTRYIDLMQVRLQRAAQPDVLLWAASTVAVGYVADTVVFGRTRLAAFGRHAYALASVLTPPRPHAIQVTLGDEDAGTSPLPGLTGVVVNNTAHLANFRAFAQARLDDGLLDVMELARGWWGQLAHNAAILARSQAWGPSRMRQAAAVRLTFSAPEQVMVDGEMFSQVRRVELHCQAQALACIYRPEPR